ncbi:uncharacterized protein N7515_000093 [Penicillium bovifimosum]|uniref:Uncharacterized protein n=1 Tax=Penicillium bovifimosum TaxID=126998 RepID=A0A9W9HEF8_9EURO|nr:uncharacterized protein N7515_000093 [Penicillium bovifimosum]KAJ5145529.1 hypothetical protein N7515_000093 [Penicillium bovifimosum]
MHPLAFLIMLLFSFTLAVPIMTTSQDSMEESDGQPDVMIQKASDGMKGQPTPTTEDANNKKSIHVEENKSKKKGGIRKFVS